MGSNIRKIFFIQIILFILSVVIISSLLLYRLVVLDAEERVQTVFTSELKLAAAEINHKAEMAVENLKAISSRSMIRSKLYEYYEGTLSLEELRDYTLPKYNDGTAVYSNMISCIRNAADGSVVADYKWDSGDIRIDSENLILVFVNTSAGCNIHICNPIVYNGELIGYDSGVFRLEDIGRNEIMLLDDVCVREDEFKNNDRNNFIWSEPIGDTGYFLRAELNQEVVRNQKMSILKRVFFPSVILIAALAVISWFTILRLTYSLINDLDSSNRRFTNALDEKTLLLRELHHRIKNNLHLVIGFINLQYPDNGNPEILARNNVLISRINAINLVHEKLQSASDFKRLEIGSYLKELCEMISESSLEVSTELVFDIKDEVVMVSGDVVTIGLIYSELLVNSIKHGWTGKTLNIRVTVELQNGFVNLGYEDDGKPFPEDFDHTAATSMGFMVINSLVKQLMGSFLRDSGNPKKFVISLRNDENIN